MCSARRAHTRCGVYAKVRLMDKITANDQRGCGTPGGTAMALLPVRNLRAPSMAALPAAARALCAASRMVSGGRAGEGTRCDRPIGGTGSRCTKKTRGATSESGLGRLVDLRSPSGSIDPPAGYPPGSPARSASLASRVDYDSAPPEPSGTGPKVLIRPRAGANRHTQRKSTTGGLGRFEGRPDSEGALGEDAGAGGDRS
jgi:hypothetical protein